MEKEIGLETDFKDAFLRVSSFLVDNNLSLDAIYDNKKPPFLPNSLEQDWDTIQEYYRQEEEKEKKTGDIVLY